MNKIINCLLLFIFLLVTFKQSDNPIKTKLYLFLITTIFQIILISISDIKKKNKVNYKSIVNRSLLVGLTSILGYSLYHDLFNINDNITNIIISYTTSKILHSIILSTMIMLPVINYKFLFEDEIKYD